MGHWTSIAYLAVGGIIGLYLGAALHFRVNWRFPMGFKGMLLFFLICMVVGPLQDLIFNALPISFLHNVMVQTFLTGLTYGIIASFLPALPLIPKRRSSSDR